jgi:hypothetical protein
VARDENDWRPRSDGVRIALLTPAAILLGSLFIAGAIVYAARLLVEAYGPGPWVPQPAVPQAPVVGGVGPAAPGPVPPSGVAISRATPLMVGSKVLALDGAQWFRAEVLRLDGEDRVRIRYTGWGPQYDRDLTRDQLQLDQGAGK